MGKSSEPQLMTAFQWLQFGRSGLSPVFAIKGQQTWGKFPMKIKQILLRRGTSNIFKLPVSSLHNFGEMGVIPKGLHMQVKSLNTKYIYIYTYIHIYI